MQNSWVIASQEPTLEELFAEPIVQMMMRRDGLHAREMQHQLHRVTHRRSGRLQTA